jgi:hypothetical protein
MFNIYKLIILKLKSKIKICVLESEPFYFLEPEPQSFTAPDGRIFGQKYLWPDKIFRPENCPVCPEVAEKGPKIYCCNLNSKTLMLCSFYGFFINHIRHFFFNF